MNTKKNEEKIRKDAMRIKKAMDDMVDVQASQFSNDYKKIKGEVKETLVDAAATVKKEVGMGLKTYNNKAQKFADKLPGGFGTQALKYPWVAISLGLLIGLFVGGMLKPARR